MAWKRLGSQIVAQASDADVMLADLQLGVYYTIGGSGTDMWNAIDRGFSREQIVRRLESIYEASPEILGEALTDFVDNLVDNDLIKPSGAVVNTENASHPSPLAKRSFVEPRLSRFKRTDPELFERFKTIRWQAAIQVAWKSAEREVIAVQVDKGITYQLCGTARDIWNGLSSGYTRQSLINEFSQRSSFPTEQIATELDQFISELAQSGLIQPADSDSNRISSKPCFTAQQWETPKMVTTEDKAVAIKWISSSCGWEPSAPRIVAEVIDNEVIIVDLNAGIYNSINGAGTIVWQALAAGQLRDAVEKTLQDWFTVSADEAASEVDTVVFKLLESSLIRPRVSSSNEPSELKAPAQKAPFEKSQITSYRDMEDVLRLDPVHDFDEFGWPNQS